MSSHPASDENQNPPDLHEEGDDDEEEEDDDYDPEQEEKADVSDEDESDGDEDDPLVESGKRKKLQVDSSNKIAKTEEPLLDPDEEKKRSDALWADLTRDVKQETPAVAELQRPAQKGAELIDTETVDVVKTASSSIVPPARPSPAARKAGLADRLSALNKKKESTLAKTKNDWQRFKEDEGLVEELTEHTKSKDSYVERQAFLQRADVRQFEQEKSVRDRIRSRQLP